jgi:hypothetical protein
MCSQEELGLEGDKSNFFPVVKNNKLDRDTYNKKLLCIDPQDMRINGDFNSDEARMLQISLIKCHGHDYCKSEEEITAALR